MRVKELWPAGNTGHQLSEIIIYKKYEKLIKRLPIEWDIVAAWCISIQSILYVQLIGLKPSILARRRFNHIAGLQNQYIYSCDNEHIKFISYVFLIRHIMPKYVTEYNIIFN